MIHLDTTKTDIVPVRLEILSPVHIGAGESLSPLNYQIVSNPDGHWVYTLDYDAWISSLSGDDALKYADLFSRSSLQKVWETLRSDMPKEAYLLSKSRTSDAIYDSYLKRLNSGDSKNELSVATRNPLNQAMLIPGSSIKGAIRTAIIDSKDSGELKAAQSDKRESSKRYNAQLEKLFGKITESAFQALKVSDFEFLNNESEFVKASEISRKPEKPITEMKGVCEVAPPTSSAKYGRLVFGRFSKKSNQKTPLSDWTFENLAEVCNNYYRPHLDSEYTNFYKLPHFAGAKVVVDKILAKLSSPEAKEAILLRVGHYSHVECVTVKNNAPDTPKDRNKNPMPFGTTRTLANGIAPFGWILLHKCTLDEYNEGKKSYVLAQEEINSVFLESRKREEELLRKKQLEAQKAKALREENIKKAEEARLAHEAEMQKQKEEAERAKAEKLARQQAEAETKAKEEERLSALSPLERAFEKTLAKTATREEVLKAFENIDTFSDKLKLAESIKAFWQKEKIWSDKKMKSQQKERVKKIQDILNG